MHRRVRYKRGQTRGLAEWSARNISLNPTALADFACSNKNGQADNPDTNRSSLGVHHASGLLWRREWLALFRPPWLTPLVAERPPQPSRPGRILPAPHTLRRAHQPIADLRAPSC